MYDDEYKTFRNEMGREVSTIFFCSEFNRVRNRKDVSSLFNLI